MCPSTATTASAAAPSCPPSASCASQTQHPAPPAAYGASPPTKNHSSGSLNSSFIWREANPNNFNVYSASVSSLNSAYSRYSPQMVPQQQHHAHHAYHQHSHPQMQPLLQQPHSYTGSPEWRGSSVDSPHSTSNTPRKTSLYHQLKQKTASNYEAMHLTPLLPVRGSKHTKPVCIMPATKMWRQTAVAPIPGQSPPLLHRQRSDSPTPEPASMGATATGHHFVRVGGLYDRRVNRSFEAPPPPELKLGPLRRSTPHLAGDDDDVVLRAGGGGGVGVGAGGGAAADGSARHSATWCCGNFVLKQWRKMHNYD